MMFFCIYGVFICISYLCIYLPIDPFIDSCKNVHLEREREAGRRRHIHICMHVCVYIYTIKYIYTHVHIIFTCIYRYRIG